MSDDPFLDRLSAELGARAGSASSTREFGSEAVRRGRRIRTQRRVGATSLAVVLVATVATLTGAVSNDATRVTPPPAGTVAPSPTASASGGVQITGTLDPTTLPQGEAAQIPVVAAGRLRDSGRSVLVDLAGVVVQSVARLGDGWALQVDEVDANGDATGVRRVLFVEPGGGTRQDPAGASGVNGFAASGDGSLVVVSSIVEGSGTTVRAFTALPEGQDDAKSVITRSGLWTVGSVLPDGRVVVYGGGDPRIGQVWDPGSERVLELGDRPIVGSAGRLVLLADMSHVPDDAVSTCADAVRPESPKRSEVRYCQGWSPVAVTAEEAYAVFVPSEAEAIASVLRVAQLGEPELPLAEIGGRWVPDRVVWEDDEHFLAVAVAPEQAQAAVVRCDTGSRCERASELVPVGNDIYRLQASLTFGVAISD